MGMTARDTQVAVNALVAELTEQLCNENIVQISSFGQFESRKRVERLMNMPGTNKRMLIPPKIVVSFKPASTLKERLRED